MTDPGDIIDEDADVTLDHDGTLAGAGGGDDELGVPVDPGPGFGQDEDDDVLADEELAGDEG